MIEKIVTFPPQVLLMIAVSAFVFAGIIKFSKYLKTRPTRPEELHESIPSNITTETKPVPENTIYPVDRNKVDFGFSQGFKFAFGFWFGTLLFFFLITMLFGSIIVGFTSALITHSVQGAFMRP